MNLYRQNMSDLRTRIRKACRSEYGIRFQLLDAAALIKALHISAACLRPQPRFAAERGFWLAANVEQRGEDLPLTPLTGEKDKSGGQTQVHSTPLKPERYKCLHLAVWWSR